MVDDSTADQRVQVLFDGLDAARESDDQCVFYCARDWSRERSERGVLER